MSIESVINFTNLFILFVYNWFCHYSHFEDLNMAVSISILQPARYVALCWMIYTTKLWLSSSILCNLVTMTTSPKKKKKNTKVAYGNGKCQKSSDTCGHLARYVALYFQHFALPGSDWVLEYFEILSQWPSPSQTPKRENQWWLGHCI